MLGEGPANPVWVSMSSSTPFIISATQAMLNPFVPDVEQKLTSISPPPVTFVLMFHCSVEYEVESCVELHDPTGVEAQGSALARARLSQAFALQRFLNALPDPRAGFFHGNQQLGLLGDIAQIGHQVATHLAGSKVLFFLRVTARFDDEGQDALEFRTSHVL